MPGFLPLLLALAAPPAVVCPAAVEYRGPALHAAVSAETFPAAGPTLQGTLDPALSAKLDQAVGKVLEKTPAPGLTAAVGIPGRGIWSTSRGLAVADPPTPLAKEPYFHWASVGKAFTAVVVLQLVEEGKLGLADPLARWFPDFPNAKAITIDHLLTHTGGVFSFQADLKFREKKGYTPPEELIAVGARHGSDFCPGEHWSYSNTGYVLLARIAEKLEGRPFHLIVRARILDPLGMSQTVALAPRQVLPGLATGHIGKTPQRTVEPTVPFGAGIIVGTARDLVVFWNALLTGKLLRPATVQDAFRRLYPMYDSGTFYGRGVMLYELPGEGRSRVWLGHSGGTPEQKAIVAFDLDTRAYVAVAVNGDVPAEAVANLLLGEIGKP